MFRKFDKTTYRWDGVEPKIYKADSAVFRDVTKQVLFEREGDLPVQFRYFQVEPGGWSSLERHEHMHMVVIFRGRGHALLGGAPRRRGAPCGGRRPHDDPAVELASVQSGRRRGAGIFLPRQRGPGQAVLSDGKGPGRAPPGSCGGGVPRREGLT